MSLLISLNQVNVCYLFPWTEQDDDQSKKITRRIHVQRKANICQCCKQHLCSTQGELFIDNCFQRILYKTRIHSSNMRTARSSSCPGGCLHQAHPPEEAPPGRKHHPGGSTPLLTESQIPVKILPCPTFVAGCNYSHNLQVSMCRVDTYLYIWGLLKAKIMAAYHTKVKAIAKEPVVQLAKSPLRTIVIIVKSCPNCT